MGKEKGSVVMKKGKGSIRSMFMHADGVDLLLMVFGILGCVGDGFSTPLVLYISSKLMNNIGGASLSQSFQRNINKVCICLCLCLSYLHIRTRAYAQHTKKANWVWFCWVTECCGSDVLGLWVIRSLFPRWVALWE